MNRDNSEGSTEDSVQRLKMIFSVNDVSLNQTIAEQVRRSKYGLGDRRTIEQAIEFSGLDTKNGRTIENKCGNNLVYVPFVEHPEGPNYIPKFDPITENPLDTPDIGSIFYNPNAAAQRLIEEDEVRQPTNLYIKNSLVEVNAEVSGSIPLDHKPNTDMLRVGLRRGKNSTIYYIINEYYHNDHNRSVIAIILVIIIISVLAIQFQLFRTGKSFKKKMKSDKSDDNLDNDDDDSNENSGLLKTI